MYINKKKRALCHRHGRLWAAFSGWGSGTSHSGVYLRKQPPVFFNLVLALIAHFKPKTNQYLKRANDIVQRGDSPLEEFKSHCWSYQGPRSFPWPLSWGPAENLLTWERWGFVTITTFHGMMDDKIWKNVLLVHPLGKSHIEFTFKLHNLTRQPSVFFYLGTTAAKSQISEVFRSVSSLLLMPHQIWHCLVSKVKWICLRCLYNSKSLQIQTHNCMISQY